MFTPFTLFRRRTATPCTTHGSERGLAQRYAAAGAAVLDDLDPTWPAKINTRVLDINDPRRCILGQLYGDYIDAPQMLRDWRRGTNIRFGGPSDAGRQLTEAWRREITRRVGPVAVATRTLTMV
jgi:hypothetical protein